MAFTGLVVGGIGPPVFSLLGDDLVTNGSFELDADDNSIPDDWADYGVSTGVLAQAQDLTSFWGDYVAQATDDNSGISVPESFSQTVVLSGNISSKTVLIVFYAKYISGDDQICACMLWDNVGAAAISPIKTFNIESDRYVQCSFLVTLEAGLAASPNLKIALYPTDASGTGTEVGVVNFDNVQAYEVAASYTFPQPNGWGSESNQLFAEELQAGQRLIDGTLKKYTDGWRYNATFFFEYLSTANELLAQRISDHSGLIAVQAHNDVDWFAICQWNGDFARRYFYGRFIGHTTPLAFLGTELIPEKPEYVS